MLSGFYITNVDCSYDKMLRFDNGDSHLKNFLHKEAATGCFLFIKGVLKNSQNSPEKTLFEAYFKFAPKNMLGCTSIKANTIREQLIFSKNSVIWVNSRGFSYVMGDFRWFQLVSMRFQVVLAGFRSFLISLSTVQTFNVLKNPNSFWNLVIVFKNSKIVGPEKFQ